MKNLKFKSLLLLTAANILQIHASTDVEMYQINMAPYRSGEHELVLSKLHSDTAFKNALTEEEHAIVDAALKNINEIFKINPVQGHNANMSINGIGDVLDKYKKYKSGHALPPVAKSTSGKTFKTVTPEMKEVTPDEMLRSWANTEFAIVSEDVLNNATAKEAKKLELQAQASVKNRKGPVSSHTPSLPDLSKLTTPPTTPRSDTSKKTIFPPVENTPKDPTTQHLAPAPNLEEALKNAPKPSTSNVKLEDLLKDLPPPPPIKPTEPTIQKPKTNSSVSIAIGTSDGVVYSEKGPKEGTTSVGISTEGSSENASPSSFLPKNTDPTVLAMFKMLEEKNNKLEEQNNKLFELLNRQPQQSYYVPQQQQQFAPQPGQQNQPQQNPNDPLQQGKNNGHSEYKPFFEKSLIDESLLHPEQEIIDILTLLNTKEAVIAQQIENVSSGNGDSLGSAIENEIKALKTASASSTNAESFLSALVKKLEERKKIFDKFSKELIKSKANDELLKSTQFQDYLSQLIEGLKEKLDDQSSHSYAPPPPLGNITLPPPPSLGNITLPPPPSLGNITLPPPPSLGNITLPPPPNIKDLPPPPPPPPNIKDLPPPPPPLHKGNTGDDWLLTAKKATDRIPLANSFEEYIIDGITGEGTLKAMKTAVSASLKRQFVMNQNPGMTDPQEINIKQQALFDLPKKDMTQSQFDNAKKKVVENWRKFALYTNVESLQKFDAWLNHDYTNFDKNTQGVKKYVDAYNTWRQTNPENLDTITPLDAVPEMKFEQYKKTTDINLSELTTYSQEKAQGTKILKRAINKLTSNDTQDSMAKVLLTSVDNLMSLNQAIAFDERTAFWTQSKSLVTAAQDYTNDVYKKAEALNNSANAEQVKQWVEDSYIAKTIKAVEEKLPDSNYKRLLLLELKQRYFNLALGMKQKHSQFNAALSAITKVTREEIIKMTSTLDQFAVIDLKAVGKAPSGKEENERRETMIKFADYLSKNPSAV